MHPNDEKVVNEQFGKPSMTFKLCHLEYGSSSFGSLTLTAELCRPSNSERANNAALCSVSVKKKKKKYISVLIMLDTSRLVRVLSFHYILLYFFIVWSGVRADAVDNNIYEVPSQLSKTPPSFLVHMK